MLSIGALVDRFNRRGGHLVERLRPAVERLLEEVRSTIDIDAWKAATTARERLIAISWRRAGIGAGALATVVGGLMFAFLLGRPGAYPPPEPTAREIALHQKSVRLATATPPPSLVEANKSWKSE